MQLYKVKPKNPYYFWAVMSIVLQATTGRADERLAMNMLLPLAEKMIAKMAKEKKMEQEQETHLYLMVLELQKKFQEALEVLDGPIGDHLKSKTSYWELFNTKKLDYLKKLEKWSLVNSLAKDMLQQTPDQWNVYLDFITSVFHLIDQKETEEVRNFMRIPYQLSIMLKYAPELYVLANFSNNPTGSLRFLG